ncbi:toxin-antitoxin system YwqK family antitoxin [Dulcicalothrix desertica]|nr:hypothetical protein [Dulcicalothrix desertica]TWH50377.1 MORN repeat protein [Dulcicalothrix desertica PCC 7102]
MRVSISELDYSDYHVYIYQGKDFTGIAYENSNSGQLLAENSYVDGVLQGISREWYENGQLHYEYYYESGALDGLCKEWYESGQLKIECLYKFGIIISKKQWNEDGKLIEEYELDEIDANFQLLKKLSKLKLASNKDFIKLLTQG